MDASAYLRRQGWRGDGHSLDHTDRGIKKPLLVSKKVDVLGVGLNKHAAVSDQWWMRAFDQGLKSLGTGEQTTLAQVQKHGVHLGGLYGRFVKGEKFAGSIGQSLLPTPEDSDNTLPTTPLEVQAQPHSNMGVDVPPEDKLERVVGRQPDQHGHDAMMHLLQNPKEAPQAMRKMLDRKRKRAERPMEKRARRKTMRQEKMKEDAEEKRRQAMEAGTWDAEKEEEHERMRAIDKRAKEFVLEAQRRGIIPAGPNEIRRGLLPTGPNASAIGQPRDEMQIVLEQAGLSTQANVTGSSKNSVKAQKYEREKMKRELKRAAKAYLLGEKAPHELTEEEKKAKKEQKKLLKQEKFFAAAKEEADKMAGRENRARHKAEKRARKKVEREGIARIIAEREAAKKAAMTLDQGDAEPMARQVATTNGQATSSNEFENGADVVKFTMNSRGGVEKIPGIGVVDRYPTKGEKKAKKLLATAIKEGISEEELQARIQAEKDEKLAAERIKIDRYRAMKHGMSLEDFRDALARGEVLPPRLEKKGIAPEKLKEYQKRAAEKGMKLEEYVRRREEKKAAQQSERLGNPFQQDVLAAAGQGGKEVIVANSQPTAQTNGHAAGGLSFVVDTIGDENLIGGDFSARARAIIANAVPATNGKPIAIVDAAGDTAMELAPNMPVPLDPRLWAGIKPKDLPKPIRKARQKWMAAKREARKSRAAERGPKPSTSAKSKAQRKVEAREAFVKQVLFHSRQAVHRGQQEPGMMTIEGIENVPLVKLETREGMFKKGEVGLARTVARRVLRNVRRQQKADKGKGKGWKKRERAEKEAARNRGISGFTDKARLEAGGSTSRDLLL